MFNKPPVVKAADNGTGNMDNNLDQDAVRLSKAIRRTESSDNFTSEGQSGEYGAYQFTKDFWEENAPKYLGEQYKDFNYENLTPENQNKVAYHRVKELKDQGYKPDQIAGIWNHGSPDYQNAVGVNKYGVAYDTPAYVNKVRQEYEKLKQEQPVAQPITEIPKKEGFGSKLARGFVKPFVKGGLSLSKAIFPNRELSIAGQKLENAYTSRGEDVQINSPKEALGTALSAGATFAGGEGLASLAGGLKGAVVPALAKGALAGLEVGALQGAGESLQNDDKFGKTLLKTAEGGAIGAATGGVLGGLGAGANVAVKLAQKGSINNVVQDSIGKEVDNLLTSNKSLAKAVKFAKDNNTDIATHIKSPDVFSGLKVENGKINPDEAISTIQDKIDAAHDIKSKILPELDRVISPTKKEEIRAAALNSISGTTTPADEQSLVSAINRQIDALPEEMTLEQQDKYRAIFRKAARDARGLQKSDSEYAALENAFRNNIFSKTEKLPYNTNGEYSALQQYQKDLIATKDFLDKNLRRETVKGGRLNKYIARSIGAIAGTPHGILGTILGSEVGGVLSDIIVNNQLGNSIKMKLIRQVTDDPEVIQLAEQFLKQAKTKPQLALPPASSEFRKQYGTGNIIVPPVKTAAQLDKPVPFINPQ